MVLVVYLAGSGAARAKDLDGILRLFATRDEQAGATADTYGGTLDLRWKRNVTPVFSYLLALRYNADSQELLLAPDLGATDSSELEPRAELRWLTEDIEFSVGGRWQSRRSKPEDGDTFRRDEDNTFARFRTTFEKAPNVLLEYDRRDTSQDLGPDQLNTRLFGQVGYSGGWWTINGGLRRNVRDIDAMSKRTVDEILFGASLSRNLARGKVNVFANYTLNDLDAQDELDQETLVPVPRILSAGLAALDDTPLDGALALEPALIDGDTSTPTQINIGGGLAGGSTFWNIGAELPLEETVDIVDLWLSAPIPLENAAAYSFAVYRSNDNVNWFRVTSVANRTYDPFEGRFRLQFTPTSDRFIKVVNTTVDDTLGAVFVSEIEMFGEELREGVVDSATRNQQASAVLTWSPNLVLTTVLSANANRIRNETEQALTESEDETVNLTFNIQPHRKVATNIALLNSRRERTNQLDEADIAYSGSVTWFPYQDLDLTLVGSIRDRERGTELVRRETVVARAASLLTRGLSGSVEYEWADEQNFDIPDQVRRTFRAAFDLRPRQEFNYITSLLSETIDIPSLPEASRERTNLQWRNRFTIRPSSVIGFTFELTRFEFTDDDGWARVFQFDWLPFPGGTLQFSLDYRKDAPLTGAERTVRAIGLRWNMNRSMFLDITGTRQTQEQSGLRTGRTIINAFFQARI